MNRQELIKRISEQTGEYQCDVKRIIESYEDNIISELLNGGNVHLHGFITLFVKESSEKNYINPMTKQQKILPPTKKIRVKVSDKINRQIEDNC